MMAATKQEPVESAPVHRGWWRRNWKRLVVGTVLVVVLAAVGGYFAKFGPVLFSEPYQMALNTVERSPQVKDLLGEPVKRSGVADWTPTGMFSDGGQMKEARLTFSISGPKGSASVMALARSLDGQWGFAQFDVTAPEGKRLNLLAESNAGKPVDVKNFDPSQPQAKTTTTEDAPPDLNVKIDLDPPQTGK
jgi:hypothetical protein